MFNFSLIKVSRMVHFKRTKMGFSAFWKLSSFLSYLVFNFEQLDSSTMVFYKLKRIQFSIRKLIKFWQSFKTNNVKSLLWQLSSSQSTKTFSSSFAVYPVLTRQADMIQPNLSSSHLVQTSSIIARTKKKKNFWVRRSGTEVYAIATNLA